ncbi:MAG: glycerol kinase, partial [Spirochaetales bacterium]
MSSHESYILALDQGTTSSRAIVFNQAGTVIGVRQIPFNQVYPQPGWVEHDPEEIWQSQYAAAIGAIETAQVRPDQIAAIGITNQRETTLLWDRTTGKPVHNAIVWQCRRSAGICQELKALGYEEEIRKRTGLVLDPYFSGTKLMWLFDQVPGLRAKAERGDIMFGTVDTWLIYRLTGKHATDATNASRTLLFNIHEGRWDQDLLRMLNIP